MPKTTGLVGENVQRVREQQGWSPEQLAQALDMPLDTLHALEAGHGDIDLDTLDRIAAVLKIKHRSLFDPNKL